ncbi:MAG: beta-galactosidase, partial [Mycetocola sp.]
VNIYMFHGGTNFGLTNGANHKGRYVPILTSYDYDAPLDESGHPTEKFWAFRDVIARYAAVPDEQPEPAGAAPESEVPLTIVEDNPTRHAGTAVAADPPPSHDACEHRGGLMLYRATLPESAGATRVLEFPAVRDAAWVSVDGRPVGRVLRALQERSIVLPPGRELQVVVEDQGRVNYADRLGEQKGLIGQPLLDGVPLTGWRSAPLDLRVLAALGDAADAGQRRAAAHPVAGPVVLAGEFDVTEPHDLFISTDGWGRGVVSVNGFLLGRYWRNGPQRTLYVPAPVLRRGLNTVSVVELEVATRPTVRFVSGPDLGHTEE